MSSFLTVITIIIICSCSKPRFDAAWTKETAPETFVARFETSKGNFDVEVTRAWSPKAVDRLYQLFRHHYFDNVLFYRVVPKFVVQFGNIDTTITRNWEKFKVADEPVLKSNIKGILSFARSGKDSRGTDLFINLKDNVRLDTSTYSGVLGFPGIGAVINGMDVVEKMYDGYSNKTMDVYDSLSANRMEYLKLFPLLDSIRKAYVLKKR